MSKRYWLKCSAILLSLGFGGWSSLEAQDIERARQVLPADRIRSIDKPVFKKEAMFLKDSDQVLGVVFGEVARAYPLLILNAHEVCNDDLGPDGLSVTW